MTGIWSKPRRFLEIKEDKKERLRGEKALLFFQEHGIFYTEYYACQGGLRPNQA